MKQYNIDDYVCPTCWNILRECTCANQPWNLIMIDRNIQYIIRALNNKGYMTAYCCESHFNVVFSIYISFAYEYNFSIPLGFKYDTKRKMLFYKYSAKENRNEKLFSEKKNEMLSILREWVDVLEPINSKE